MRYDGGRSGQPRKDDVDDHRHQPLPGISVTAGRGAVRVTSERPLTVLSSAVVGGGLGSVREILNVHVDDKYDGERPEEDLAATAAELGITGPFVGLMTAAYTEYARWAVESAGDLSVAAVVSVGLSNTASAGVTPPFAPETPAPGTINIVLLVDGALTPAAMVNAVITATEAKTMTLAEWDVRTPEGEPASGTSTDTVVVACTGRGAELGYAGPATPVGWLAARAVRVAMTSICTEKVERDGGRCGW
jgi:iron complex transport system ATP-binding protein